MKNLFRAATVIAALALSTSAHAQQRATTTTTNANAPQIGLGVGLTAGPSTPDQGYLLYVPVQIGQLRVEPFLGWSRSDTDFTGKDSDVTIGVGAFFVQPVASQIQLYAGGRLGSQWVSHQPPNYGVPGSVKTSSRNTLLAVAAGGEYLPIPRVAVGAELQMGYMSVGDTKAVVSGGGTTEAGGGSGSGTQATVFVRVFLF